MEQTIVKPAEGKLGIMVVGCGAVATTFMTGVFMARKGLAKPVGSMTQYDKIRIGRGADKKYLHYKDIVPLADLKDIVFGTWDVYPQNAYQAAMYAEVLKEKDINPVREELEKIVPMKAAFDKNYAKRLDGDNVKDCKTRWEMVEALRQDIRDFKAENDCSRIVVIWAASTEIYVPVDMQIHGTLASLEAAMKADDRQHIAPSMCYAYAALTEGAPFIMGAPNTTVDIPAMWELAEQTRMPIAGKDFKTGQTLVKSGFAPIIGTRCLGLNGWFSTNILGNRDGLVLDEPANFHTKEVSKLSTLETILKPEDQPDLYGHYAKRLDGDNVKDCKTRWEMVEALRQDIRDFKAENDCSRIVVIWAASTEIYVPVDMQIHGTLASLEAAMKADDRQHIAPSMCYAYAALTEGAPFIMGAPNTTVDIPAMWELAEQTRMPIAGKDFKTGQTLVKSGFAPIIGTRCLGLNGWFSTNILGNRDGLVLDEPANFHTKEVSKLSTLETILKPEDQPDLYGHGNDEDTQYYHKVRINYYPPRNDNKEGWDNIDIFGWMGYPMQIKINFLCRDSILAAPLLLDLCLLLDLAARAGRYGTQRFLSFFLKAPMHDYTKGEEPVNHLYQQYTMLKNAIREMGGYEADEEID